MTVDVSVEEVDLADEVCVGVVVTVWVLVDSEEVVGTVCVEVVSVPVV